MTGAIDERTAVGLAITEGDADAIRELYTAGVVKPFHREIIAAAVGLADYGRLVTQREILQMVEQSPYFDVVEWAKLGTVGTTVMSTWTAKSAVRAYLDHRERLADSRALKSALETLERGGDRSEYLAGVHEWIENTKVEPEAERQVIFNATELMSMVFEPIAWVVPGLLTVGLSLLVGVAKLGKSWLIMAIGTAVSVGGRVLGKIKVPQMPVLLLLLEDTPRRFKSRMEKMSAAASENLTVAFEWPNGPDGIAKLDKWLTDNPDAGLVVIDTLGRFYPMKDGNDYNESVRALSALKHLADKHEVAILAVHHAKKAATDDFLQSALGSTGIAATADNTLMLKRGRGKRDATLHITGRDVEEAEYALQFDGAVGTWTLEGTTAEVQESTARQDVYDWLKKHEPATPKEIHEGMADEGAIRSYTTVKRLLRMMEDDGAVISMSGIYRTRDGKNREPYEPNKTMNPVNPVNPESNDSGSVHEFTGFTGSQGVNEPDPAEFDTLNTLNGSTGGSGSKSDTDPDREKWLDEHDGELF